MGPPRKITVPCPRCGTEVTIRCYLGAKLIQTGQYSARLEVDPSFESITHLCPDLPQAPVAPPIQAVTVNTGPLLVEET